MEYPQLKKSVNFSNNILMIGYGAVARCTLPLIARHIHVPLDHFTIIDLEPKGEQLAQWEKKGIKFIQLEITKENLAETIKKHTNPGDVVIDLSVEIDTLDFLKICYERKVMYVNASVEEWEPYGKTSVYEKTLYYRHMELRKWLETVPKGPTAVLDHGANPGLISAFVKQGLVDIANKMIVDDKAPANLEALLQKSIKENKFGELAMKIGVKVIHCSERDTQLTNNPKVPNEFVNTWSVDGFYEEGIAPAELGWGTHEKTIPSVGVLPPVGPKNQIFLEHPGLDTWVRSFVPPDHHIIGMVIRHGEAFSISERLAVYKDGQAIYRPTVHYAYMPCDGAVASLLELRGRNHEMQSKQRILRDHEIVSGRDTLGALLMGHDYKSWWTGSSLSIEDARKLVPGQNATTVQVAAGVLASVMWMIENPNEGVCLPDDLSHEYVLEVAKPYLGDWISSPFDWDPLSKRQYLFERQKKEVPEDPWQFQSFLYRKLD